MVKIVLIGKKGGCRRANAVNATWFVRSRFILNEGRAFMVNRRFQICESGKASKFHRMRRA